MFLAFPNILVQRCNSPCLLKACGRENFLSQWYCCSFFKKFSAVIEWEMNENYSSKRGYCYGIFYSNDESNGRIYPQIYIPANNKLYFVYHSLCHELSHYFQWYLNDDKRSDRSLEAQASKYADRILEDFCCYYCKETDDSCKSCYGQ